ncbi:MAG: hypothetical protein JWN44_5801 [Myxococcales bacterium]|nr:hypothetical protein [Myxococcales bacterium]
MRAVLLAAACTLAACAGTSGPEPTTGMTLTVEYNNRLANISLSGTTLMTARKFGPYVLSSSKLGPGDTVGFTFDAGDAGMALVCGDGRDRDNIMQATGCGSFAVRSGEITTGTLTLTSVD